MVDPGSISIRKASYDHFVQRELANRTPEQVAYDMQKTLRNRVQDPPPHPLMTPQDVIDSRTDHLQERKRALSRSYSPQFRVQIEAEIASCEHEIATAVHRIELGLTQPY